MRGLVLYFGIPMTAETYDDEVALSAYAFRHFLHLLTPLERRVTLYGVPIVSGSEHWKMRRLYEHLEQRDGHVADADQGKALFDFGLADAYCSLVVITD